MEYRSSNVDVASIRQVIEVRSLFGEGTMESPKRVICEYYSHDGVLLARSDPAVDEDVKADY